MCPCGRLGLTRGGGQCQLHGGESPTQVTDEFPGVGDTSVRGKARTERDHPIERGERLVVAAELDEGVPGDAVWPIRARQQSFRTAAVPQRCAELVAYQRERAETEHRVRIVDPEPHGTRERLL